MSATAEAVAFPPQVPPEPRYVRHRLARCPEIDCIRDLLPPAVTAAAELRAVEIGTGADRVLVAQNVIADEQYVKAWAFSLGVAYDPLLQVPRKICPASDMALINAVTTGILWFAVGQRRVLVIAPHGLAGRHIVAALRLMPELAANIRLTTSRQMFEFVSRQTRRTVIGMAVSALESARPEFSASTSRPRRTFLPITGCLATLGAFLSDPALVIMIVDIALALIFLCWAVLRGLGALTTGLLWRTRATIQDRELPVYSIIIALYREAAVVEGLVEALKELDYPPEKLDIKLVLEADDHETRHALERINLGPSFTIFTAPEGGPRTKPKALNAALPFARGAYVAVFDAEDRPGPDQLKKALHAFRCGNNKLACVQARLSIDNSRDAWLTRMFAAEYAGLFDAFLPGIAAWRLPLPLGGSSNHFRTSTLRQTGAWDPYNVTEDADLGMRLARFGYHTAVIDSTTFEEAPAHLVPWLKQRTRWFKGWMQTWLVHMRHPLRLWRDLGTSGFLVFQLVVGGTVLAALVHGVFAVAFGWQLASGWLWAEKSGVGQIVVAGLHVTTLVSGYLISGALGFIGLARRRMLSCSWALLLMPLYWLFLSVAAWRALLHLILKPYAWEKTEHALARRPLRQPISRESAFTS